jgi:hypothetical protein
MKAMQGKGRFILSCCVRGREEGKDSSNRSVEEREAAEGGRRVEATMALGDV